MHYRTACWILAKFPSEYAGHCRSNRKVDDNSLSAVAGRSLLAPFLSVFSFFIFSFWRLKLMQLQKQLQSTSMLSGHMNKAQRGRRPWMNLAESWADVEKLQTFLILKYPFWFLVQLEFGSKCLLKAPFLLPLYCLWAFRVRWWQIASYLISFIVLPSGDVCSNPSESSRTNKQPLCLMDHGETSDLPALGIQHENNMLR